MKFSNVTVTFIEAGGIIQLINGARSENAKDKLTKDLRWLRDRRTFEYSQRNPEQWDKSKPGENIGNAKSGTRLQAGSRSSDSLKIRQNDGVSIEKNQRVPWKNFPPAIANNKMGSLRFDAKDVEAPEYDGAKRKGNVIDAIRFIQRKLSSEKINELKEFLKQERVDLAKLVILPVDALEGEGKNKIPLAIAKVISERLGGAPVDTEIKQANKVSRTGQGINHRLAFMPTFAGTVEDREYLIVDDTLRVGGTIANLGGYIDQNGGKTAGIFAMQSDEQSLTL